MLDHMAKLESNHLLACLVDLGKGKIHLLDGEEIVIGRSSDCNIYVKNDTSLSRRHVAICNVNGDYYVQDLGSRNGTILNSQKVGPMRIKLQPDDKLTVGKTVYCFSPIGISEALYGFNNQRLPYLNQLKAKVRELRVRASGQCRSMGLITLSQLLMPKKERARESRKLQSVTEPNLPLPIEFSPKANSK
jgi:pSer/pThr/pTyr-binding forkhead associated (FHA) protein